MLIRTYTDPITGIEFEGLTDEQGNFTFQSAFLGSIQGFYNEAEGTITLPAWTFQEYPTMTLNEAASFLGVSKVRVSRMCTNGTLKSHKIRGSLVIDKASVMRYKERGEDGSGKPN